MKFNFRLLTQSPERLNVITTKLGALKTEKFTTVDTGKPMVMGKKGNMSIAADGDIIEGFLDNVDAGPTADGFVVGGVARCNAGTRMEVWVEGAADVLDLVVAGTNAAAGVANTESKLGNVRKAVAATAAEMKSQWRIISFADNAESTTGGVAVIEKL